MKVTNKFYLQCTTDVTQWLYVLLLAVTSLLYIHSNLEATTQKTVYSLINEPIDVVIPCTGKDVPILELCINGIRKNGKNIRRIIVVSDRPYTTSAEWFDERLYPFSKFDIAFCILGSEQQAHRFISPAQHSRIGWLYQQFLKLYAPITIPNISSNVLVLDADTIFLHPIEFLDGQGQGYLNPGYEYNPLYFVHMQKIIPWLSKVFPQYSGISHHMLFQRAILVDLLKTIESYHHDIAWKCICRCIDRTELRGSCLSEYEIYFNFALTRTNQVQIRHLRWANIDSLSQVPAHAAQGYHYVSCHSYSRKN